MDPGVFCWQVRSGALFCLVFCGDIWAKLSEGLSGLSEGPIVVRILRKRKLRFGIGASVTRTIDRIRRRKYATLVAREDPRVDKWTSQLCSQNKRHVEIKVLKHQ